MADPNKTKVTILTGTYRIKGYIELMPGARVTDYMVEAKDFIAVTEAEVWELGDRKVMKAPFLNVSRRGDVRRWRHHRSPAGSGSELAHLSVGRAREGRRGCVRGQQPRGDSTRRRRRRGLRAEGLLCGLEQRRDGAARRDPRARDTRGGRSCAARGMETLAA